MHVNIRFGNKQHFGEHQKIFYSTVTAPENQLCFLPAAAAAAKLLQSCLTLCNPIDGSPPGMPSWDSPGKNTGVGCHCLLQCMKVKVKSFSRVQLLATPWTAAYQGFPGKSTGVGCYCLLQKLEQLLPFQTWARK